MTEKEGSLSPEIIKLTEKMSKDPSSKLFVPLAEEYMKCGMQEEALMVLTDGIKIHPQYVGAHVSLGKLYWQLGKKEEAKKEFEQVIQANPENLMAHRFLIQVYREEGEWEKALNSCRLILSFNPKDADMVSLREELEKKNASPTVEEIGKGETESVGEIEQEPLLETTSITQPEPPAQSQMSESPAVEEGPVSRGPAPPGEGERMEVSPISGGVSGIQGTERLENRPPTLEEGKEPGEENSEVSLPEPETVNLSEPSLHHGESEAQDLAGSGKVEPVVKDSVSGEPDPCRDEPVEKIEIPGSSGDDSVIEIPEDQEDDLKSLEAAFSSSSDMDFSPGEKPPSLQKTASSAGDSSTTEKENLEHLKPTVPGIENKSNNQESVTDQDGEKTGGASSGDQEDFASESLAELYVRQGFYKKGIDIYQRLISQDPNNQGLKQKLNDAVTLARLLTGFGEEVVSDSLGKEGTEPPRPQQENKVADEKVPRQAMDSATSPSRVQGDPKLQKIQRLQAWLDNLKKGQSS